MLTIRDLTHFMEQWAPLTYQESYDNSGLLVGDSNTEITGILVTLDATEAVVDEAIAKGCNVVVAHHPIIFKGLKKLTGRNYVERTVIKAIKNDVALYAAHTNLDNIAGGVNFRIAERLELQHVQILAPSAQTLTKLITFVPIADTQRVLDALHKAGAGQIGQYSHASFRVEGMGAYQAEAGANPTLGQIGTYHQEPEHRIEVILPTQQQGPIIAALRQAHPYEEVAYDLIPLNNPNQEVGAGAVGNLPEPMTETEFFTHLKTQLKVTLIRHTPRLNRPVRRIAVCGGVGSFLFGDAIRAGADVFVTADYKYHEFFDAEGRIVIADINHYESEQFTKQLIQERLSENFDNFAVILSETVTNPVQYFL
ncbi:MAG: Nif3-like dinuclear metal center hexameric protein [Bacteroidetes bacterium]|nr:Nif3-like dinuclear metal center hexameric protein [Fibrella sp.]